MLQIFTSFLFNQIPETEGDESAVNGTDASNDTSTAGGTKEKKKAKPAKKEAPEVKENMVKVNLTADVTVLDLPNPTEASTRVSINK